VFFALKGVSQGGTVGFCADVPDGKNKRLTDYEIVVLLNGARATSRKLCSFSVLSAVEGFI
jgi:hypothetical protein